MLHLENVALNRHINHLASVQYYHGLTDQSLSTEQTYNINDWQTLQILDSDDDFRSGCWKVSHQQQIFSELPTPGQSHKNTNYWCF